MSYLWLIIGGLAGDLDIVWGARRAAETHKHTIMRLSRSPTGCFWAADKPIHALYRHLIAPLLTTSPRISTADEFDLNN